MRNRYRPEEDYDYNTPRTQSRYGSHFGPNASPYDDDEENSYNEEEDNEPIYSQPGFSGGHTASYRGNTNLDYVLSDNDNNDNDEYDSRYDENNNSGSGYGSQYNNRDNRGSRRRTLRANRDVMPDSMDEDWDESNYGQTSSGRWGKTNYQSNSWGRTGRGADSTTWDTQRHTVSPTPRRNRNNEYGYGGPQYENYDVYDRDDFDEDDEDLY